ncbi:hypothetical protein GCM10022212_36970 [Actimicrobium antarcticum]|uniref:Uncharacterized protein n=1 Tax=Actimicrobium antarcticum TaxID=1051899 RepID=A0ABP7U125_9BURK
MFFWARVWAWPFGIMRELTIPSLCVKDRHAIDRFGARATLTHSSTVVPAQEVIRTKPNVYTVGWHKPPGAPTAKLAGCAAAPLRRWLED